MSYLTAENLKDYLKCYPEDDTELERYAQAAQKIIETFIGYNPEQSQETENYRGTGYYQMGLKRAHITEIQSVTMNGEGLDLSNIAVSADSEDSNYIEYTDGTVFTKGVLYTVTYTAGWAEVPEDIVNAAYRIAGVLYAESDGNIGISSKSFGESGSRVFLNSSLKKYLEDLVPYKIEKGIC